MHRDANPQKRGWTERLLRERFVVLSLAALGVLAGLHVAPFPWLQGMERNPVAVDAIPDIGENQQIVVTGWPGRAPQIVENQITYPLSTLLQGLPRLKTVRGLSMFGFSMVYLIFEEDAEFYWTRARITERLASLPEGALPEGVRPQLGPDATALGQVYGYTLQGMDPHGHPTGGWSLDSLRTLQDFTVRYALASAEGVAEVASLGGMVREALVELDPDALRAFDVPAEAVVEALRRTNLEVGAETIEHAGVAYMVRSLGYARGLDDLARTVVTWRAGTAIRVEDVAQLRWAPAERLGALTVSGEEAVGGIVTARHGANPRAVIAAAQEEIDRLNATLPSKVLPDGTRSQVQIVPFYDRSGLIDRTVGTLERALVQQVLITLLVVLLLLFHLRGSFIVAVLLPIAVLLTFVGMRVLDIEANVVALAGIAIAIGTMVDMGIVLVDSILQRLQVAGETRDARLAAIAQGTREVRGAILTAMATTVISFLPVFALQGQEGKLFGPLAWTKTLGLMASLVVALLVLPVLCAALLGHGRRPWFPRTFPEPLRRIGLGLCALGLAVLLGHSWMPLGADAGEHRNVIFTLVVVGVVLGSFHLFRWVYPALLRGALRRPWLLLTPVVLLLLAGGTVWQGFGATWGWLPASFQRSAVGQWLHHEVPGLGREFMPQLDEGTFLFMPTTMPHASIGSILDMTQELDRLFESIPEVERSIGKLGRADTALDPAPLAMLETIVHVVPEYREDARGRRLRFAVDREGEFLRDSAGELIPDRRGRPYRQWRPEIRRMQDVWDEMVAVADVAGLTSAPLLQPISTRIVMLQSGIRAPMAVQLSGESLEALGRAARQVEDLLREHPLVNGPAVSADRPVGRAYLEIEPDREALLQHGLSLATVQQSIATAMGGTEAGVLLDGRERYGIRVRYPRELRLDLEAIGQVLVPLPDAGDVPLSELVALRFAAGPEMIRSEDARLVSYVMFDRAAGVPQMQTIEEVGAYLRTAIEDGRWTPEPGITWRFIGSFENTVRAEARLRLLIPVVLLVVLLLLHLQFRSLWMSLTIFSSIALVVSGGMLLLWLWGQPWFLDIGWSGERLQEVFQTQRVHLSVAVWVGFIAVFGIATDDGVVMTTFLRQELAACTTDQTDELHEAIVAGASRRVRACLMTSATTILALLPILTSYGTGADVMIPMSLPAIGGMTMALLALLLVPVLFLLGVRVGAIDHPTQGAPEPEEAEIDTALSPSASETPDPRSSTPRDADTTSAASTQESS